MDKPELLTMLCDILYSLLDVQETLRTSEDREKAINDISKVQRTIINTINTIHDNM